MRSAAATTGDEKYVVGVDDRRTTPAASVSITPTATTDTDIKGVPADNLDIGPNERTPTAGFAAGTPTSAGNLQLDGGHSARCGPLVAGRWVVWIEIESDAFASSQDRRGRDGHYTECGDPGDQSPAPHSGVPRCPHRSHA